MFPFIFSKDGLVIPTFFFMVLVGALTAAFYIFFQAKKKGMSQVAILDITMIGIFAGVMGARLFHVLVEAPQLNITFKGVPMTAWQFYMDSPIRILEFWRGGFVGYGAFIGIAISSILYLWVKKLPILKYVDLIALGCPLIIFMVRIGCVGAGCCYGKETDFFLHLTFTDPRSDAGHLFPGKHLHPTQIYDMINAALVFFSLMYFDKRKKFDGQIFILFFMLYGFFRFFIEFLRGDADRGTYLGGAISTSQVVGLVIMFLGSLGLFILSRKKKPASIENSIG